MGNAKAAADGTSRVQGSSKGRSHRDRGSRWRMQIIGVILLFVVLGSFFPTMLTLYNIFFPGYKELDVKNETLMKQVLFSGNPWVVYCKYGKQKPQELHPILLEAKNMFPRHVSVGIASCNEPMTSGRSIVSRFNLGASPVGFVVGYGRNPVVIPRASLAAVDHLVTFVKNSSEPRIETVINNIGFESACTKRTGSCIVFARRGGIEPKFAAEHIAKLAKVHPSLRMIGLDTNKYEINLPKGIGKNLKHDNKPATGDITVLCIHKDNSGRFFGDLFGRVDDSWEIHRFLDKCKSLTENVEFTETPQLKVKSSAAAAAENSGTIGKIEVESVSEN